MICYSATLPAMSALKNAASAGGRWLGTSWSSWYQKKQMLSKTRDNLKYSLYLVLRWEKGEEREETIIERTIIALSGRNGYLCLDPRFAKCQSMNSSKVFNAPKVQLVCFSNWYNFTFLSGLLFDSFSKSPGLCISWVLWPEHRIRSCIRESSLSLEHLFWFCSIVDKFKYYLYIIINIQIMNKNEKFRIMFNINNRTSKQLGDTASSFAYAFRHILSTRKGYAS